MNRDRAEAYADHSALLEEIDRLRAELAAWKGGMFLSTYQRMVQEHQSNEHAGRLVWPCPCCEKEEAEAAITRVRELCADNYWWPEFNYYDIHSYEEDVLRALGGAV